MNDAAVAAKRRAVLRLDGGRPVGVLPGILLAAITFAPPYIQPATAETDARQFAAHALALRAAGVAGDDAAIDVLAALPGAGAVSSESLPLLWVPFFENAMVKLGRLQSPGPVALYYNPLLDIAVFTLWERHRKAYRVRSARAVPGERLNDAGAVIPIRPQWMASDDDPIGVLAETTAVRLDAFRRAHPADGESGRDSTSFAAASADLRAALSRLVWNSARRARALDAEEAWMRPTLARIEDALAAQDAEALTAAAPDTDSDTANGLAHLPSEFVAGLALDMSLPVGTRERLLIGSLPDDGSVYVFVICRIDGDDCALRRFMLVSLLG